jgi:hypothetical protein
VVKFRFAAEVADLSDYRNKNSGGRGPPGSEFSVLRRRNLTVDFLLVENRDCVNFTFM